MPALLRSTSRSCYLYLALLRSTCTIPQLYFALLLQFASSTSLYLALLRSTSPLCQLYFALPLHFCLHPCARRLPTLDFSVASQEPLPAAAPLCYTAHVALIRSVYVFRVVFRCIEDMTCRLGYHTKSMQTRRPAGREGGLGRAGRKMEGGREGDR